jgi:sarcosine oxidase subunit alpha
MTWRDATVAGLPARVFRISFSGELAYEINVASWHGMALWQALIDAGAPHGLTPYGTEAMHVLRAEKGYIIVGQETDGSVTPQDLGMDWLLSKQKDFIGRRSFSRADTARAGRKQLVGLLPKDRKFVAQEGEHLVNGPGSPSLGHITSSYWSPTLDSGFALALVTDGRALHGKTLYCSRGHMPVDVVDPLFYDKKGERRDGSN